jgi:hypothetical protein
METSPNKSLAVLKQRNKIACNVDERTVEIGEMATEVSTRIEDS